MSTPVSEPLHATGHAAGTTATGATPTGTAGTTTSAGHTSATPGASSTGPKKGFVQALEPLFKVSTNVCHLRVIELNCER